MTPNQLVRDIRESIFDTVIVAKNTAIGLRKVLFQTPQSSTVGPETTNMTKAGELPNPEHHDVYRVAVVFTGMLAADIIAVCKAYVLRLVVSGKPLLTMPLEITPEQSKVIATIASDEAVVNLPEDYKISIDQGQPFYAELVSSTGFTTTDTNGQGLHLRVLLDGVHTVLVN